MVSVNPIIVSSVVIDQVVQSRSSIGSLVPGTDANVREVRSIYEGEIQCPVNKMSESLGLKPFRDTSFGRLAPEIRQMIFKNLLASPPAYGGHDFRVARESSSGQSPVSLATFVDLKGSYLAILQTCRQIYFETFPVFYASKSYYVANAQDLVTMLKHRGHVRVKSGLFRLDTITLLCIKNLVFRETRWEPEIIDCLISIHGFLNRESLQAERIISLDPELLFVNFQEMKSLRKICLCMLAGQERECLKFLFNMKGFGHGVIEFIDDFHWSLRSQNVSADDWKLQYPGFCYEFYRMGKNFEPFDFENLLIQKNVLDIKSRASDLTKGDERWIEIDIGARSYEETRQHHKERKQHHKEAMQLPQAQPRKSTQTCTKRSLKSQKMSNGDAHTPIDLVQSKNRHTKGAVRARNVQKKLTKRPTAPETPQIPLTPVAARNSSLNPEKEKLSLSITYTKFYLRAATLILALSLAYIIQSKQIEKTVSQLLILFHAILLFFVVVAVFSEESG